MKRRRGGTERRSRRLGRGGTGGRGGGLEKAPGDQQWHDEVEQRVAHEITGDDGDDDFPAALPQQFAEAVAFQSPEAVRDRAAAEPGGSGKNSHRDAVKRVVQRGARNIAKSEGDEPAWISPRSSNPWRS